MARSRTLRPSLEILEGRCVLATFTVTKLSDGIGVPGMTLREAITSANATAATDTITFKDTLKGTIILTSGEIAITKSLVINGPGAGRITVSGGGASRIFNIDDSTATLTNVTIRGLSLTGGNGSFGAGGAILSNENLTLSKSNIHNNLTMGGFAGGGMASTGGSLTLIKTTVSGNRGTVGGGIDFAGTNLTVNASSIFDNLADGGGGLQIAASSTASITNSTIANNQSNVSGGGLNTLGTTTVRRCSITGNTAAIDGGGLRNESGSLTIDICTIAGNITGGNGGGVAVQGTTVIANSTLAYNLALQQGGGLSTFGGAADLTVRNSTISGNTAVSDGGGLALLIGGQLLAQNSTIAFNRSTGNGGGIFAADDAALVSTIVARNLAVGPGQDLASNTNPGDQFTLITCLIGNTTDADINAIGSNQLDVNPLLGPLANNGGPTQTHALLPGSPAINNGSNPATLKFDQRGTPFKRQLGPALDIGAFERQ